MTAMASSSATSEPPTPLEPSTPSPLWQSSVLATLTSLQSTPPDCYLVVGRERVPAHRTALLLNSSLLSSPDVTHNPDFWEVDLDPEFGEDIELVREIVDSFYHGNLAVSQENMRRVYKFAKCYNVSWIRELARAVFGEYLQGGASEKWVEVAKFAQFLGCEELSEMCCGYLTTEILSDISREDIIDDLGYHTIKTISLSNSLVVPEKQVFGFVMGWLGKHSSRNRNFGGILMNIKYDLIDKDYLLEEVLDLILEVDIEREKLKELVKLVKQSIKMTAGRNVSSRCKVLKAAALLKHKSEKIKQVDKILAKLDNWVASGGILRPKVKGNISEVEIDELIKEFPSINDGQKDMVFDYLLTFETFEIDMVFDKLCPIFEIFCSLKMTKLFVLSCLKDEHYSKLYWIPWHKVPLDIVGHILKDEVLNRSFLAFDYLEISCYGHYQRFKGCCQIEIIMLWVLANLNKRDHIFNLFRLVPDRNVPPPYFQRILKPCLKILSQGSNWDANWGDWFTTDVSKLPVSEMRVGKFPDGDFYASKGYKSVLYTYGFDNHRVYSKCWEGFTQRKSLHSFVFFKSTDPSSPRYPLFLRYFNNKTFPCSSNINEFECMFYKNGAFAG